MAQATEVKRVVNPLWLHSHKKLGTVSEPIVKKKEEKRKISSSSKATGKKLVRLIRKSSSDLEDDEVVTIRNPLLDIKQFPQKRKSIRRSKTIEQEDLTAVSPRYATISRKSESFTVVDSKEFLARDTISRESSNEGISREVSKEGILKEVSKEIKILQITKDTLAFSFVQQDDGSDDSAKSGKLSNTASPRDNICEQIIKTKPGKVLSSSDSDPVVTINPIYQPTIKHENDITYNPVFKPRVAIIDLLTIQKSLYYYLIYVI